VLTDDDPLPQEMEDVIVIESEPDYDSEEAEQSQQEEQEQEQEQPVAAAGLEEAKDHLAAAVEPIDPAADKLKSTFAHPFAAASLHADDPSFMRLCAHAQSYWRTSRRRLHAR
jgi:hypothetical protein